MDDKKWTGVGFGCLNVPLVGLAGTFTYGWAIMTLWNWFIPVGLAGAPELTFPAAAGIALIVSLLESGNTDHEERNLYRVAAQAWVRVATRPIVAVIVGWTALQLIAIFGPG